MYSNAWMLLFIFACQGICISLFIKNRLFRIYKITILKYMPMVFLVHYNKRRMGFFL